MSKQDEGNGNQGHGTGHGDQGHGHDKVTIHIDRKQYQVDAGELTGAQLRQVAQPPIGGNYDLWLEVPGGEDKLIGDDESVEPENGMHFFSTQKHITPGA